MAGIVLIVVRVMTLDRTDLSTNVWTVQAVIWTGILLLSIALWLCIRESDRTP